MQRRSKAVSGWVNFPVKDTGWEDSGEGGMVVKLVVCDNRDFDNQFGMCCGASVTDLMGESFIGDDRRPKPVPPENCESAEAIQAEQDAKSVVITDLKSWLAEAGDNAWLPEEGTDIRAFINEVKDEIDSHGYIVSEDVEDCLLDMWANRLYNGDPLPSNVAKALREDGRCNDSAWVSELESYAESRAAEDESQ